MKDIKRMFLEIKFEILKIIVLNSFLRTAIIFLIIYLPASFFGLMDISKYSLYVLIALCMMFFLMITSLQFKRIKYKLLEEREPMLADILTTAHDTLSEENVMVRAMWRELAARLRKIRPVMFFEPGKIFRWIVLIFVLSAVTTLVPTATYELARYNVTTESFKFNLELPTFRDSGDGDLSDYEDIEIFEDESIFGDRSLIILGQEELAFEISQDFSGIDFSKEGEGQGSDSEEDDALSEVYIPKSGEFEVKKAALNSRQQKEWIKNYFDSIDTQS